MLNTYDLERAFQDFSRSMIQSIQNAFYDEYNSRLMLQTQVSELVVEVERLNSIAFGGVQLIPGPPGPAGTNGRDGAMGPAGPPGPAQPVEIELVTGEKIPLQDFAEMYAELLVRVEDLTLKVEELSEVKE